MKKISVALVGNPNCGKSTLFNALTGAQQKVGNWPGVTVERKNGFFAAAETTVEVIDLPGLYSLSIDAASAAIDERITSEFILQQQADIIINIVDASHLERHLYLSTQLREMGVPIIIVLNMMDVARARNMQIDVTTLKKELACPVVLMEAHKKHGVAALKHAIATFNKDEVTTKLFSSAEIPEHEDADIFLADQRYHYIEKLLQQCVSAEVKKTSWTSRIDKIVLNRILGIPIFLAVMYLLFLFSINVGGALQEFFDHSSETIFVTHFRTLLEYANTPTWLIALLADGAGKGINTVITFIPVIGALFLFLSLLEDSGYMARAAFVVDRFMRTLSLPGKAFVPMIVGFGCNVPAVMAARTLENKRDRIITILMTPFMSCGARLAIYAVFTAAFFPHGGQNIVFALYLIGIAMAVLTGFILRHSFLKGDPAPLVMELPAYHVPQLRTLFLHAWQRLKGFVFRAGKLIVPVCAIVGALSALHVNNDLGKWLTPMFSPMGIHADNWPATVGLLTGVLAKEVVVGTLNTLYSEVGAMYQQFDGQIGAFAYLLFVLLYFPCVSTMAVMLRELNRGWAAFSAFWSTAVAYAAAVIFYQAATYMQHPLTSFMWIAVMTFIFFGTIFLIRKISAHEKYAIPTEETFAHCIKPACGTKCLNCTTATI